MEQRLEFVREYETELFTMTELAAQYGVGRKTAYKWLERNHAAGAPALFDQSRRPRWSPKATDAELVEALLAVRRRHPRWGPKKLLAAETTRPRAPNCIAQQQRFRRFCRAYNEQRPHEALSDEPPTSCYDLRLQVVGL
jgi:transposase